MSAREVAERYEGYQQANGWWRCKCPSHNSDGLSLSLIDGEKGLVVKCWGPCSPSDVLAAIGETGQKVSPQEVKQQQDAAAIKRAKSAAFARRLWRASVADDPLITVYLASRGITWPGIPKALRLHPANGLFGKHKNGTRYPQLVAGLCDITGKLTGVHRTWLAVDGQGKAPVDPCKIMYGVAAGSAIRLTKVAGPLLMLAEGIETAMTGLDATGYPTWATGSTSGLKTVLLPPEVREVRILADHDKGGQEAANSAGRRFQAEGRKVLIITPSTPGTDFNDMVRG